MPQLPEKLRRATLEDATAVADLYLRSREAAGAAFPPGLHPPSEVLAHVAEVQIARRETWIREADGVLAGFLVLDGDQLDWLFVDPAHQGRGLGSALIELARQQRPGGLALWVFVSNHPARRFYEQHGFRMVRGTDGADNEEHAPDLRYVWGEHQEGHTKR
ncbi:L-amino acid N-acyltransferase YncA [Jatrophihabitans sp. GAS493]|uniref:GNAT family N-acetyltransferase n=1 Tax=Jatrophihabitans sp. GAS493 TaxID=1907575 RepID=UPI000BB74B04|nr:GNAT family N-acetyltransferase [Jatrophihabitans sp. GAS493]SOD74025.1 L-amino acid N-acyltransferase YncA [Jatrophihabitans sp. GAS493]